MPRQDLAQRLGQWLDTFDTLKLHAAHQTLKALAQDKRPQRPAETPSATLEDAFHRVRTALGNAIAAHAAAIALDAQAGYAAYRRRHVEHQQRMATEIGGLRAQVRQVLSKASPALRQLAYLDAAMDQMVGGREQKLLSTVAVLLERQYTQLRQAHVGESWQEAFGKVWQEALLAEMNVRLQPVVGLMEALGNEVKKSP